MKGLLISSIMTICIGTIPAHADDFIAEDFEDYTIGKELDVFRIYGGSMGKAIIEAAPKKSNNKALHFTTDGWNSFPQFTVTLPEGKTIKDYAKFSFDLYRTGQDDDYKCMDIRFNNKRLLETTYLHHADLDTWAKKSYDLDGFTVEGNTLTISLGTNTNIGDYYIDNVVFSEAVDLGYDIDNDDEVLRTWASVCGKKIGMAVSNTDNGAFDLFDKPQNIQNKTLYRNFNMIVAGNEMKYSSTEPQKGKFDFTQGDKLVEYAEQYGMTVRGHTLVWHTQLPEWMNAGYNGDKNGNNYSRDELLRLMKNHIMEVVGHWKGQISEWDVVNEALAHGGGSMRNSIWYKVIGEEYIDSAFVWAHQADPDAILYINDYNVEQAGKSKADDLYELVKRLVDRNVPIHGVGLQTHVTKGGLNFNRVEENVKRYADLGLNCIFTETDIRIKQSDWGEMSAWEDQAKDYRNLAEIQLRNSNCPNLVIWGIADPFSWILSETSNSYGEPLIFGEDFVAKPAFFALRDTYKDWCSTTGVNDIEMTNQSLSNSEDDGVIYNLMGIPVGKDYKGIVIIKGKKILRMR